MKHRLKYNSDLERETRKFFGGMGWKRMSGIWADLNTIVGQNVDQGTALLLTIPESAAEQITKAMLIRELKSQHEAIAHITSGSLTQDDILDTAKNIIKQLYHKAGEIVRRTYFAVN